MAKKKILHIPQFRMNDSGSKGIKLKKLEAEIDITGEHSIATPHRDEHYMLVVLDKGKLSGNEYDSEFSNNYYAGNVNGKVRLGQLLNDPNNYSYKTLTSDIFSTIFSNIYLGAGAGIIKNRISRDISSYYANAIHNKGGGVAKDRYGYHFVVPLNVGLDVPFGRTLYGPKWAINLNYQHTLTTNDNLDGIINGKNDQYGVLSLGIKYALFNK